MGAELIKKTDRLELNQVENNTLDYFRLTSRKHKEYGVKVFTLESKELALEIMDNDEAFLKAMERFESF